MADLLDSYTTFSNTDGVTAGVGKSQSFACGGNYTLDSCRFNFRWSTSSITGEGRAYLYAMSGTYGNDDNKPTGSALATSDAFDLANVTSTITYWTFTFSEAERIALTTGNYCIVFFPISVSGGSLAMGMKNTSGLHTGNKATYSSGSWTANADADLDFYVYGVISGTNYTLTTSVSSVSTTGINTTITSARSILTSVGNLTISGIETTLKRGIKLITSVVGLTLTGISAGLNFKGWTWKTKNTATYTQPSKNSTSYTLKTKSTAVYTQPSKNSTPYTQPTKHSTSYSNKTQN